MFIKIEGFLRFYFDTDFDLFFCGIEFWIVILGMCFIHRNRSFWARIAIMKLFTFLQIDIFISINSDVIMHRDNIA